MFTREQKKHIEAEVAKLLKATGDPDLSDPVQFVLDVKAKPFKLGAVMFTVVDEAKAEHERV